MREEVKVLTEFVRVNFDEIAIITGLTGVALHDYLFPLSEDQLIVLAALRRSSKEYAHASLKELGEILSELDDVQITGLVNNVKGILFEMEFVRIENSDEDAIFAYQFSETNHPTYDIQLVNRLTGEVTELQLKASDNENYIRDWIEEHGNNIVVTDEVAESLGLQGIGIGNQELEVDTREFVSKLIKYDDISIENVLGSIGTISIAISIAQLSREWIEGRISREHFLKIGAMLAGQKIIKFSLLSAALAIPGVNFITACFMTANLAIQGKEHLNRL